MGKNHITIVGDYSFVSCEVIDSQANSGAGALSLENALLSADTLNSLVMMSASDDLGGAVTVLNANGDLPRYYLRLTVSTALVQVPEPSTWALLILGALGVAFFRRKK